VSVTDVDGSPRLEAASGTRSQQFQQEIVRMHSPGGANRGLVVALQIARKYRTKPTIEALMRDFGMCRATAYRWRAAWQYVSDKTANET